MITEAKTLSPLRTLDASKLQWFAVTDAAMSPKLEPFDSVAYEPSEFQGDGLYAVYDRKGDRIIARRIERKGDTFSILAADPQISPIEMTGKDMGNILAGKVRQYCREE